LNEVYGVLRDPIRREAYDASRIEAEYAESIDLEATLPVSLFDLFVGAAVRVDVYRTRLCTNCRGVESLGCTKCSGFGHLSGSDPLDVQLPSGGLVGGGEGHQYRAHQSPVKLILAIPASNEM